MIKSEKKMFTPLQMVIDPKIQIFGNNTWIPYGFEPATTVNTK